MDFSLLDLRIGLIKKVEDHPKADRLYKLTVDVGDGEITLVAGLKGYYRPEELTGKRIVVVYNLESKKLRGVLSQGMLLAADNGREVGVLTPLRKVMPGTRIELRE